MDIFYNKIKKICNENEKVAMFIDMDGTIVEYTVYGENEITTDSKGIFANGEPLNVVIENLRKINEIENIDLYILTLSKSDIIVKEKKEWLKKYANFINERNWIIINKEKGEYTKENRDYIKAYKMEEKLPQYDKVIFLDDDHKILKEAKKRMKDKVKVFHVSSAII